MTSASPKREPAEKATLLPILTANDIEIVDEGESEEDTDLSNMTNATSGEGVPVTANQE